MPDLNATIAHSLGMPLEKEVISSSGRPFTVANKSKVVMGLFGWIKPWAVSIGLCATSNSAYHVYNLDAVLCFT